MDAVTVDATRKSLLDALGVTLAAGGLCDACRAFVNLAVHTGGHAQSSIIGFGTKVPIAMAALANGAMAHALDFEDSHDTALVHPNAAAIPAALAVAEAVGPITGRQFIAALAVSCDLVCRLGAAFTKNPIEYGWYPPPILGAFGATAAAGKLLGLSSSQLLDAFSLTLCQATCSAELRYNPHSDIRAVRDAFAAQAGIQSALLAQQGVRGFEAPFEGKAGLYRLYADGHYTPGLLTADLGRKFAGADLSFKPWPACRGTHAYIEAALSILKEYAVDPGNITRVHATVSGLNVMLCEPLEAKQHPATAIDAKFSLPFVVATALMKNRVQLDDFLPSALMDPQVLALAAKMTFEVDHGIDPAAATQGALTVYTSKDRYDKKVKYALGNPQNPMSRSALVEKFMHCASQAAHAYKETDLSILVDRIWALEEATDVGLLISCL